MCTVSWLNRSERLEIFCNRDEQRSRKAAEPPRVEARNGTCYIAPEDGDAKGTWVAANEYGLAITLLNHYPEPPAATPEKIESRGQLVLELMACKSTADVHATLLEEDLERYRPFWLLAMQPGLNIIKYQWDGAKLYRSVFEDQTWSVTTSSVKNREAASFRWKQFEAIKDQLDLPSPEQLRAYHLSQDEAHKDLSVRMERDLSLTVSVSHIIIDRSGVSFEYWDESPFDANSTDKVFLKRIDVTQS